MVCLVLAALSRRQGRHYGTHPVDGCHCPVASRSPDALPSTLRAKGVGRWHSNVHVHGITMHLVPTPGLAQQGQLPVSGYRQAWRGPPLPRHLSRESFACMDYSLSKKRHSRAACPTSQAFCPGGEAGTRTLWLGPAASTSPGQDQTLKFPCFVNRGFEVVVRPVFNQNSYFISSPWSGPVSAAVSLRPLLSPSLGFIVAGK